MFVAKSRTLPFARGKYPGLNPRVVEHEHFVRHQDVAVSLRDGTVMYVDIYMPNAPGGPVPTIIGWSPYGKHGLKNIGMMPNAGVEPGWASKFAIWEGADPVHWCPSGYAIVSPDPRGAWSSQGELQLLSRQEGEDGYDLIEWLAAQDWSNGKVGLLGVSYLAMSQWRIASTRPPSLAAICPWEGVCDVNREFNFHGGIPERTFHEWWGPISRFSLQDAEDFQLNAKAHPLFDEYWQSKCAPLEQIDCPALVVASWTDQGMHTRGTLEGYKRISSRHKWLIVHGTRKWAHFYMPENVAKQKAFFDTFLKGETGLLDAWPPVEIEVRNRIGLSRRQTYPEYPVPSTSAMTLFLDAADASARPVCVNHTATASYDSEAAGDRAVFQHRFEAATEVVGTAKLKLWIAAESWNEADIFVGLDKIGQDGERIPFYFFNYFEDGPLALGWLRASHRALDPGRSTVFQPWHPHDTVEPLVPGRPVPVEIEIWPSGTRFEAGEAIRLIVQGNDLCPHEGGTNVEVSHSPNNRGRHVLHTGGSFDSHLVLPVVS